MTGIFVPKREINDELERHCDRIQKELEQQFDPGDPVQTRHGRPLWDAQVAIARDKLEVTMKMGRARSFTRCGSEKHISADSPDVVAS